MSVVCDRRFWFARPLVAVFALFMINTVVTAEQNTKFHYDEQSAATASYFAAISNLANTVMFSGLGESLIISPYEIDKWLQRAGYVTRPPMPDIAIVGPVYAVASPKFDKTPDYSRAQTLRWDSASFDRTLDPGAQAWALMKITSPQFHLQFHDLAENKLAALMMIPQAKAQAKVLEMRLRNPGGLFAALTPKKKFLEPTARDQAAVLWAVSNLILASTSMRENYWHRAYRDLVDANDYRVLLEKAFTAVSKLPAQTLTDRSILVEALGRYALITTDAEKRRKALQLARQNADVLVTQTGENLEDIAMAIYGLIEAGRLFQNENYSQSAGRLFSSSLMPLWVNAFGIFKLDANTPRVTYTPRTLGALMAAINAIRWHGSKELAAQAQKIYPRFFEQAIIRSGMLRTSPLPLVSKPYIEAAPTAHFAHPVLPSSIEIGIAPVFASKVTYEDGHWRVVDPLFRTADAMFLTNMLSLSSEGRSDIFFPNDRLAQLK